MDNSNTVTPKLNENLITALLNEGVRNIYLFTNMSTSEIEDFSITPDKFTRKKLISHLRNRGLTVLGVITPADPTYNQGLGAVYENIISPLYARVEKGELNEQTICKDAAYLNSKELFRRHKDACSDLSRTKEYADIKGIMFEYFLRRKPPEFNSCIFFDDDRKCKEAAKQANARNSEISIPLTTIIVDKKFTSSVAEYQETLRSNNTDHDLASQVAIHKSEIPAQANYKQFLTNLQNEIVKDEKEQYRKWNTSFFDGRTVSLVDTNGKDIGSVYVSSTMSNTLARIQQATRAARANPQDAENLYKSAIQDIGEIFRVASQQNESWYSRLVGRDGLAIELYSRRYQEIRALFPEIGNQRPVLGGSMV